MFLNRGILTNMEMDSQEIFVAGIRLLIAIENKARRKESRKKLTINEVAEGIGVTPDNLSGFLNFHRNYSETKRKDLAKFFGKEYFEVIDIGRNNIDSNGIVLHPVEPIIMQSDTKQLQSTPQVTNIQNETTKRHQDIVSLFENTELALEINQYLVEIERLEGEPGLAFARSQMLLLLNEARRKSGLAPLSLGERAEPQKTGTEK